MIGISMWRVTNNIVHHIGYTGIAIGLPDGASGIIHGNQLVRTEGGAPPLLAVKGGSVGIVSHNSIRGGGVAGIQVQGDVQVVGNRFHGKGPSRTETLRSVREGPWKLVVTYGKQTTYALFHIEHDPQQQTDLSTRLEQITFRLRGLLEQREAQEFQREMRPGQPG